MQNPNPVELDFVRALFGSKDDFEGNVVHAVPPFADSLLQNSGTVKGNIVIVKRGLNTISEKAHAASEAGAIGWNVVNWADRMDFFGCADDCNSNLPIVCVKQKDALDLLKDGSYAAFKGASRSADQCVMSDGQSFSERCAVEGIEVQLFETGGTQISGEPGSTGEQFNGLLDMGDSLVFVSVQDDGSIDCVKDNIIPDHERIRGILNTSYDSLKSFDNALEYFDSCMRSWQEKMNLLGPIGASSSTLEAHFSHLATARQLRTALGQVEECNSASEALIGKEEYKQAISDLTASLSKLQTAEAALRGRDELRISLLDLPQKSYALLQDALVKTGQIEEALTVAVQAKARSLSHMLECMDRSRSRETNFSVGKLVRIHGLQNELQYEGRTGTVLQVGEIVLVDVSGQEIRVRRQNLKSLEEETEDNITNLKAPCGGKAYLPDMKWAEVQRLVQEQECAVMEYFMLSDQTLGIWLIERTGLLCKYQTISTSSTDGSEEGPSSFKRILEQTRAAMGVVGRQAIAPVSQDGQSEPDAGRDIDQIIIDHLVLLLENQTSDEEMNTTDKDLLKDIQGTPSEQAVNQARCECRDVRNWLRDVLVKLAVDQVDSLVRAATSWRDLKSWNDHTLLSDFGIQRSETRRDVLKHIESELNPERLLRSLHSLLISPFADALRVGEDLLIIPHGILFGVPWAALMDSTGHYLVEKHAIRLAPSLRVAAAAENQKQQTSRCPDNHNMEERNTDTACVCDKCAHNSQSRQCKLSCRGGMYFYCNKCRVDMCSLWSRAAVQEKKCVVVGNPWPNSCGPLPFAEEEAEKTFSALQQAEIFDDVKIATASRATKPWVLQHLDGASWVHLACHAKLETNSLILTKSDQDLEELSLLDLQSRVTLRSGSTVVLSACNTGMGQICGEGVVGLSRGILAAGGGAAAVSLWSISDKSTKVLMAYLYSFLLAGFGVSQAMRHAMLKMLGREPMELLEGQDPCQRLEVEEEESHLRSFTNKQGKAELEALRVLFNDGNPFVINGQVLAIGNGLDERGMATKECCRSLFGVSSYPHVWSERGPALKRARMLNRGTLKLVLLHVNDAIGIRVDKGQYGSDAGHQYMLQTLRGVKVEMRKMLMETDKILEDDLRGRSTLKALEQNSSFPEPKYWASFVVTGGRTFLPGCSHQPELESAQKTATDKHTACELNTANGSTSLSLETVCERLKSIGLSQYCNSFEENSIDGSMLDELENLWDELEVEKKAHRIKILKCFGLRPNTANESTSLSLETVCERLKSIGLSQYCNSFEKNSIGGSMLDELENLWDELEVEKKAHRIKILKSFGLRC